MSIRSRLFDFYIRQAYLLDWAVGLILLLLAHGLWVVLPVVDRWRVPGDESLRYPFRAPIQPTLHAYIVGTALPIAFVSLVSGLLRRNLEEWHHGLLAWLVSSAINTAFFRWMSLIGRYRPNYVDSMEPSNQDVVDATNYRGNDAWPQSSAATALHTGAYLFWYISGLLHVFSKSSKGLTLKLLLALSPVAYTTWLAMTRLMDYWADFSDFNTGCFIGIATGTLGYMLYHHSPTSADSGRPRVERQGWSHGFKLRPDRPLAADDGLQLGHTHNSSA